MMMERRLEPEVMDDAEQSRAYAEADFAQVNQGFVDRFRELYPELTPARMLDLGCGPADIPRRFALAYPALQVVAVDASAPMLALGREALAAAGLNQRVELLEARIPGLDLPPHHFPAVVSNSLLHHLPDPAVLWSEIKRLGGPGAAVLVMDLFRPDSEEAARRIVDQADCSADPVLQHDFYHSLLAAFTPDEVRRQLETAGLGHLNLAVTSERHLQVWGCLQ
jgi:ubiquinone/menaquinone biosynthesis C-methylase UbiE